jgi:hypothetical protein
MRVIFITGIKKRSAFKQNLRVYSDREPSYFKFQICTCLHTGQEGAIPLVNTTY